LSSRSPDDSGRAHNALAIAASGLLLGSRMRRTPALFALLIAWLFATGSQWDLVQAFAWGRMFTQYAQTMSVAQAARLTFTPTNMCSVCQAVAKAKQQEENNAKPELKTPGKLLLALVPAPVFVLTVPDQIRLPVEGRVPLSADLSAPPSPPPRVLA